MSLVIVVIREISRSTGIASDFQTNSLLFSLLIPCYSLLSGNFETASLRMIGGDGVVRPYGDNCVMAITALGLRFGVVEKRLT
jgi:hypothetical protein